MGSISQQPRVRRFPRVVCFAIVKRIDVATFTVVTFLNIIMAAQQQWYNGYWCTTARLNLSPLLNRVPQTAQFGFYYYPIFISYSLTITTGLSGIATVGNLYLIFRNYTNTSIIFRPRIFRSTLAPYHKCGTLRLGRHCTTYFRRTDSDDVSTVGIIHSFRDSAIYVCVCIYSHFYCVVVLSAQTPTSQQ